MVKPQNIPANAIWNEENQEWEYGVKQNGKLIGEWQWWLADGHLVCKATYDDNGVIQYLERYHQDSTYSQKVTYKNGKEDGTCYYQASRNYTTEVAIPEQAPQNIFRMEYVWEEGEVQSTRHWDINDDEVDQHGNIINPVKRGSISEAAVFDEEYQEWSETYYNDLGQNDGIWKWWRTDGSLYEEHHYTNGQRKYMKFFHPNGDLASETIHQKDSLLIAYRQNIDAEHTDIDFPRGSLNENIVKLEYWHDKHGYMKEWKGYDKEGKVIQHEELNLNMRGDTLQKTFDSLEEASKSWNERGKRFYTAINRYVDQFFIEDSDVGEDEQEPYDDRKDMERQVINEVSRLNKEGKAYKARELFNPALEPFNETFWQAFGKKITKVVTLQDSLWVVADHKV
ncbi:MAG: hypothetical protein AAF734_09995, partial [Bacteroidota bacterium]